MSAVEKKKQSQSRDRMERAHQGLTERKQYYINNIKYDK